MYCDNILATEASILNQDYYIFSISFDKWLETFVWYFITNKENIPKTGKLWMWL